MERAAPIVSRISPCPCGSGRRYKECHGAVRDPVEPVRPAPRLAYRPVGPDWDHLPESKRDACGQMMQDALRLQIAGQESEAERLYREVLNIAPHTHDALHMLGAISLNRGDLDEAEKLIKDALALRQEYPTIRRNLGLVQDAINARQQQDVRALCEWALPLLADEVLLRTGRETSVAAQPAEVADRVHGATHVVADFGEPGGETEWFARRVAALLSARGPRLWSLEEPANFAPDSAGVRTISAVDRQLPLGGVQILIGIDCDLEGWIEQAAPDRLLVFGLAASSARYLEQLRGLAASGAPPIEMVFRSQAEAARFGRTGPILPPPIELAPTDGAIGVLPQPRRAPFTLGTVGREERSVRVDDGKLLQELAAGTCRLSILAPGQLRYVLGRSPATEFHSRRELPLSTYLARVDAFLHRVPDAWEEGCGRALFGAMARGLPVLCSRDSLYAEYIDHERSGLLFADDTEAAMWARRLAADENWARDIGAGARARAAELFDPARLAVDYRALVEAAPRKVNA